MVGGGGVEAWWPIMVCDQGIMSTLVIIHCCRGRAD
jgi:hypothetical protein